MKVLPLNGHYSLRVDNALIVDFISTTAGVFQNKGYLNSSTNDSLRLALKNFQNGKETHKQYLLQELASQDLEYLYILSSRYGYTRLNSNILRFSLKPAILKFLTTLSTWGSELVPLSKRLFNRSFLLYEGVECEKRFLYSTVLLTLAESIEQGCQQLWIAAAECNSYFPHAMVAENESELNLDEEISQSLGFKKLNFAPFPQLSNKYISKIVFSTIEKLLEIISEITFHMGQPKPLKQEPILQLLCECIRIESKKLIETELGPTNHLIAGDVSRLLKLEALTMIEANFENLGRIFLEMVVEHQKLNQHSSSYLRSKDIERKITTDLIYEGETAKKADNASRNLLEYLGFNTLSPKDVLTAELSKINHSLTPRSLQLLQDFCSQDSVFKVSLQEKKKALESANKLTEAFKVNLSNLMKLSLLMCFMLFTTACGVKTNPSNDIIDYRPEIPTHENPRETIKHKNHP